MLAFTDTLVTKEALLAQLREHARADALVQNYGYWRDGKGCAVGCTIHGSDHAEYEPRFGIPQMLARLEDTIFEGLPVEQARTWPIRFIEAVPVGGDLSRVGWKFLHWLLTDETVNPGINNPLVRDAIKQCADVLVPLTKGQPVDRSAAASAAWSARSARSAAESAASAAWSAASAASAAWSAAWSAESAAASAASAAWSAAESAAASAAYVRMSEKLIELMRAAA